MTTELEVGQSVAVLQVQSARCIAAATVVGRVRRIREETRERDQVVEIVPNDGGEPVTLGDFGGQWRFLIENPLDADRHLVYSIRSPLYWIVPLD